MSHNYSYRNLSLTAQEVMYIDSGLIMYWRATEHYSNPVNWPIYHNVYAPINLPTIKRRLWKQR